MKRISLVLIISLLSIFALAACSDEGNNETVNEDVAEETTDNHVALQFEPEDINPEQDVCDICAMAVADDQHATQIVLNNDRALKFDDLGCLYGWIEENGEEEIGAKYIRDFHSEEWVLIDDATYVYGEEIETPMSYGIISFKDYDDAENYIEENDHGELLSAADLIDHKWEMMNHDHDEH